YSPTRTSPRSAICISPGRPAMMRFQSLRPAARNVPAKKASDVTPRNFVNSRRATKPSSSEEIGKSLDIAHFLRHVIHDVELDYIEFRRRHDVHFCANGLLAKLKIVERPLSSHSVNLFTGAEEKRLAGTDCRAHGLFPDAGAVKTHVALHHLIDRRDIVRN